MASLNRCDFIGRITKDVEIRHTASGQAVTNFTIACGEKYKNQSGEWQEKTEWINVVLWGKLAEIASQYTVKGQLVYISGRMQTREYEKDGIKRYATEIVGEKMQMLSPKGESKPAREPEEPSYDGSQIPF